MSKTLALMVFKSSWLEVSISSSNQNQNKKAKLIHSKRNKLTMICLKIRLKIKKDFKEVLCRRAPTQPLVKEEKNMFKKMTTTLVSFLRN